MNSLALLGTDARVLLLGQRAVEHNTLLTGIWASDHNQALIASLRLGCCAFPQATEPLATARCIIYSETDGQLPPGIEALDVRNLCIQGSQISGSLDEGWRAWLIELGFEPVP